MRHLATQQDISLYGASDAILLESNGHFGMVDSGEDWDYPSGSTGSKYPYRYGITTNEGYEQQVIHYLKQLGVEKLDFYIATHAHSDHIGSGDEIIEHFPVDRLYIAEYDDSYQLAAHGKDVTDPYYYEDADEDTLWDNQYVYDRIIQAAQDRHVEIITDLDLEENGGYRRFRMGNMNISIMNYERKRDADGNIISVANENDNSLVVRVNAYGIATEYVKTESEWVLLDGTYYYFDSNGRVTTGWGYIGNAWYYFDEKGEIQCGWQKIGGSWYFFKVSVAMDHDMWIQGVCYLKSSGAMAVSEWVDYNRYYVDERGIWAS